MTDPYNTGPRVVCPIPRENVNGHRAARAGSWQVQTELKIKQRDDMRHTKGCEGKLTSCRILQGVRDLMARKGKSVTTVTMREPGGRAVCHRSVKTANGGRGSGSGSGRDGKTLSFIEFPSPFILSNSQHPLSPSSPRLFPHSSLYLSLFPTHPPFPPSRSY